jgi:hypothetical protein
MWSTLNVAFDSLGSEFWAVLTTASAAILAAAGAGLVIAIAFGAKELASLLSARAGRFVFHAVLFGCAALGGFAVGDQLAAGKWVSQQAWSQALPYGTAVALGIGAAASARLATSSRFSAWMTAAFAAGAAACAWIDANVYVGLYFELHLTLYVLGAFASLATGARLAFVHQLPAGARRVRAWNIATNIVLLVLTAGSAAILFATPEEGRSELAMHGGTVADVHEVVAPPPPSNRLDRQLKELREHDPPLEPPPHNRDRTRRVRNIVLVMVDALRADALDPVRSDPGSGDFVKREDTPFLNDFLQGCHRFRRAYSQSSATHRSIPPTFRSVQAWEDTARHGTPLGTAMQFEGMETFAVVNNYFFEQRFDASEHLLDGFERVFAYPSDDQVQMLDFTERALRARGKRATFGWIHFFSAHAPGYDGEKLSMKLDKQTRYRRGVKWFDASLKTIVSQMRDARMLDDTAIVLASDHGEGLGQHDIRTHGPHIYEEAVRVPLAFCLPDDTGSIIDQPVSNVDIVPTLFELIGARPDPAHRGRSLMPLMNGETLPPRIPYFENWGGNQVGIFDDPYKLVYREKSDLMFRFDVRNDPGEEDNLYSSDSEIDTELRRSLFRINPSMLRKEMNRLRNRRTIRDVLAEVDPRNPRRSLPFLLTLGSYTRSDSPKVAGHARRIFREADRNDVRLLVTRRFGDYNRMSKAIQKTVDELDDAAERTALVDGLAAAPLTRLDEQWLAGHLEALVDRDFEEWRAWLRLLKRQPNRSAGELIAVGKLLERAADPAAEVPTPVVRLLLAGVARVKGGTPADLPARVRTFADHEDSLVQAEAVAAIGRLRDTDAIALLEKIAVDRDDREGLVRQAAIYALADVGGKDVAPTIVEAARDPYLALDGIKTLRKLGALEELKDLRRIHRNHFNRFIRREARKAVRKLKKKAKKRKARR